MVEQDPRRLSLEQAVLADPTDLTARLVLADWLEEHGEQSLGHAWRYSARRKNWPRVSAKRISVCWVRAKRKTRYPTGPELPWYIFDLLRKKSTEKTVCRLDGSGDAAVLTAFYFLSVVLAKLLDDYNGVVPSVIQRLPDDTVKSFSLLGT